MAKVYAFDKIRIHALGNRSRVQAKVKLVICHSSKGWNFQANATKTKFKNHESLVKGQEHLAMSKETSQC